MTRQGPNPSTTLGVILGASEFPRHKAFTGNPSFFNSAKAFNTYFTAPEPYGLGLPPANVLNLFDSIALPDNQLRELGEFLVRRRSSQDLVLYYVGHGGFTSSAQQDYYLALRVTEPDRVYTTLEVRRLAQTVTPIFSHGRVYVILDCCFAGAAVDHFQSSALALAMERARRVFPETGTAVESGCALFVAASRGNVATAPMGEPYTRFSGALLAALGRGDDGLGPRMTLAEIDDVVVRIIQREHPNQMGLPQIHSPRQDNGNVAHVPLFPNPAAYKRRPGDEPTQVVSFASLRGAPSFIAPSAGGKTLHLFGSPVVAPTDTRQARPESPTSSSLRMTPPAETGLRAEEHRGKRFVIRALPIAIAVLIAAALVGRSLRHPDGDGQLRINTIPSDATILVDGVEIGQQSPVVLAQHRGTHRVSVVRLGYERQDRDFEVKAGDGTIVSMTLDPAADTGFTVTSSPSHGLVWMDGMAMMVASGQARTPFQARRIPPGQHLIEVGTQPGSESWRTEIDVEPGRVQAVHAILVSPPPVSNVAVPLVVPPPSRQSPHQRERATQGRTGGGINLVVEPPAGRVWLDGKPVAAADPMGLAILRGISTGPHKLEVRDVPGYLTWSENVRIDGANPSTIKAVLVASPTLSPAQTKEIRQFYDSATRAYDIGRYEAAIVDYQKVYELCGDPPMLFNIAQAYRLSGKPAEAIRFYYRYLQRQPNAKNREDVERWITVLSPVTERKPPDAAVSDRKTTTSSRP